MRDIKFRALIRKIADTPMWVSYSTGELFNWEEEDCIVKDLQYTGLKDKNGKEIYEGDILEIKSKDSSHKQHYSTIFNEEVAQFQMLDENNTYFTTRKITYTDCEVIGNIYSNPELLKEDK